jgi:hypothetical protein
MSIDQPSVMWEGRLREGERRFLGSRQFHEGFGPTKLQFLSFGQDGLFLRYNRWPMWDNLFSRRRGLGEALRNFGQSVISRGQEWAAYESVGPGAVELLGGNWVICASCQLWKLLEYFYLEKLHKRGWGVRSEKYTGKSPLQRPPDITLRSGRR